MSIFQFLVNVVIAIVACAVISYAATFVVFPLGGLVVLVLWLVAVVLTFKSNAAAQLGV